MPARRSLALAAAVVVVVGATVAAWPEENDPKVVSIANAPVGAARSFEAASLWEFSHPRDWRTYTDHVSVVVITSERRGDLENVAGITTEGHVGAIWTAEVEETLWSAPGVEVPSTFEFLGLGYSLKDGALHPLVNDHVHQIDIGDRFVAGWLDPGRHDEADVAVYGDQMAWTPDSLLAVDDAGIAHAAERPSAGAAALDGKTLAEIDQIITTLTPDPIALPYLDKPGDLRYLLSHPQPTG